MAIKDFGISEDMEHKKPTGAEPAPLQKPVEESESAQIKNAHATGDGSFGRADESLPEESEIGEEDKVEKEGSSY